MKKMSLRIAIGIVALLALGMMVSGIAVAADEKVGICHATGNGTYRLISVSQNAVPAHMGHGDAKPGDILDGYLVADDCSLQMINRVESVPLNFSGTGWGGWSCPTGTTVVGGGYEPAEHTVLISEAAKPGSASGMYPVYPHYTFPSGETGWVVQNGGEAATLTIYVLCLPQ